jgi:hypothetical protein
VLQWPEVTNRILIVVRHMYARCIINQFGTRQDGYDFALIDDPDLEDVTGGCTMKDTDTAQRPF